MNAGANEGARRPLASRGTAWARWGTRRLAATSITPNQVSLAGVLAAVAAGLLLAFGGPAEGGTRVACLLLAALLCQLRLLCNLFDGLLAVEASRGTPDGGVWNEVPDRVADVAMLVGLGFAAGLPWLGWMAATFAVSTAYVREHGRALGQGADFRGPMAKQQRVAVVTGAAVVSALWSAPGAPWTAPWTVSGPGDGATAVLTVASWVIVVGSAVTSVRRTSALMARLNASGERGRANP